jgi:hypothetical protein
MPLTESQLLQIFPGARLQAGVFISALNTATSIPPNVSPPSWRKSATNPVNYSACVNGAISNT